MRDARKRGWIPARGIDGLFGQAGMAMDAMDAIGAETAGGAAAAAPMPHIVPATWPRFAPWAARIEAASGVVPAGNAASRNGARPH